MRGTIVLVMFLVVAAAGCRKPPPAIANDVAELPPGYGVMVAAFEYVPGKSTFPRSQVFKDASYVAGRLAVAGYDSFVARTGDTSARVGVRVPTYARATAVRKEIDSKGSIDLKDGNRLPVAKAEIVNLAELKASCRGSAP